MENLSKEEYNFLKTIDTLNLALDKSKETIGELEVQNKAINVELLTSKDQLQVSKVALEQLKATTDSQLNQTKMDNEQLKSNLEKQLQEAKSAYEQLKNTNDASQKTFQGEYDKLRLENMSIKNELTQSSSKIIEMEEQIKTLKDPPINSIKSVEERILKSINEHSEKIISTEDFKIIIGKQPEIEEVIGGTILRKVFLHNYYRIKG